jgi:hypothetical protein
MPNAHRSVGNRLQKIHVEGMSGYEFYANATNQIRNAQHIQEWPILCDTFSSFPTY